MKLVRKGGFMLKKIAGATALGVACGAALPMMCKRKGDSEQRPGYTRAHVANSMGTALKSGIVATGAYVAAKEAGKMGKFGSTLVNGIDKVGEYLVKTFGPKAPSAGTKGVNFGWTAKVKNFLAKAPKQKAVFAVGALAVGALVYLFGKHFYNAGKIDQKYAGQQ